MSVENTEENRVSEESDVCVGDGTTCVECGKVFTHPFYFSTHISTHTNQRGFVVVGQCALCGLVFSNAAVFAAHLSSSQTRLETQVTPEDDNQAAEDYSDGNLELTSQNNPDFAKNSSDIRNDRADKKGTKQISSAPQASEAPAKGKVNTEIIVKDESKLKRKRRAPERFEVDTGPQIFPLPTDVDPEVEAYLLSLKEMGLTVDPAAFSSHRGGKRRRKGSESGFGKGKGRKELMWRPDAMDFSPDMQSVKKASPKYEYLDSDDSFEDDPEVLPVSGKLTRGQRLQQRLERLSQTKEQGTTSGTKKQSHAKDSTSIKDEPGTVIKDEPGINTAAVKCALTDNPPLVSVSIPKLNTTTAAVKLVKPTPGPGFAVKKEMKSVPVSPAIRNLGRTPTLNSGGKTIVNRTLPQPNLNKFNTVRSPAVPYNVGKTNHNRTSTLPNMNNSNMYPAHSAGNSRNIGQKAVRFPQGDVRGRRGDATRFPGTLNVQKSSSLEDLKKNSRENVEQMLQSVGMMAVTSSAMIQGKFFSSQKEKCGEISFPPVKNMGLSSMYRPSFPHRGFPNRSFRAPATMPSQHALLYKGQSKFLPKQIVGRGQTPALANSPRGRQIAGPQTFKIGPTTGGFSYPQSVGHVRGAGAQRGRGQHQHNNMRGVVKGSTAPIRGKTRSITSPVQSLSSDRGRATTVQKQTKPGQGSSDIIVIDDDDIHNSNSGDKDPSSARNYPKKSPSGHINKGKVTILDVDLDSGASNIEVIEDKSHDLPLVATIVKLVDKDSLEQLPDADGDDLQDVENESEIVSSNSGNKRKDSITDETLGSQTGNKDDPCISKSAEPAIMPEEDIDGWKVSLAENSDSNEDLPSPNNVKTSSGKDQHLTPHDSPGQDCSLLEAEMPLEDTQQDHCSHQGSSQDLENIEKVHPKPDVPLTHCVSSMSEATVGSQSVCELQDNPARNDDSPDKACSEGQDTREGAETRADHTVSTPHSPMISECETSSNDITEDNVTGCDIIISENKNENLKLSLIDMEQVSTENTPEDAETPVQPDPALTSLSSSTKCANDKTMEDQESRLNPDRNGSCSLSVDNSVSSNNVNTRNDSSIGDPTKRETEENCLKNKDIEKSSDVALALSDDQMDKADSSVSSASAESKASSNKEEANSFSVSENRSLETGDADNGELNTEKLCSTPSIGCSNVATADNEDCVNGAASSESSASQTSAAVPVSFLKDVNSLLDIFTEIEKTCKEMEETQAVERENQTVFPSAEGNMKRVTSDIVENKKGNIKIVKDAESSNGMSSNEEEAKEDSNEDGRHSEMQHVKEVIDDKSEDNINEDVEDIEETENEHLKEKCRKKNDIKIKTIESEHSVTACDQETRQTTEAD